MTPAFLTPDVCRALVAAGMVVEDGHCDWWVQFGSRWERQYHPKYSLPERVLLDNDYTPAVTPLQALDWLVVLDREWLIGYLIAANDESQLDWTPRGIADAIIAKLTENPRS